MPNRRIDGLGWRALRNGDLTQPQLHFQLLPRLLTHERLHHRQKRTEHLARLVNRLTWIVVARHTLHRTQESIATIILLRPIVLHRLVFIFDPCEVHRQKLMRPLTHLGRAFEPRRAFGAQLTNHQLDELILERCRQLLENIQIRFMCHDTPEMFTEQTYYCGVLYASAKTVMATARRRIQKTIRSSRVTDATAP